ncbi:MAG: cytidylate kinase family protein [Nitrospirae bacterium]|nr:cytidylate kinase family protein [Nitrospirota bacterium]
MHDRKLIPSIERRLAHFDELCQKAKKESKEKERKKPTITISREFGCEGYPLAEKLKELLEEKTKEAWSIMDKALLDEVTKNHKLLDNVLGKLGEKSRVVEEVVGTFSSHWKTERDYYKLLCKEIFALALGGNVILVGRGSAIVTQSLDNCFHFRLFASTKFKIEYISKKTSLSVAETEAFIEKKHHQRESFVRDFLNCDSKELKFYHMLFNNDRTKSDRMAQIITDYVLCSCN